MCNIIIIRHGDICRKEDEHHDIDKLTQTAIVKSCEYPETLKKNGLIPNAVFYEGMKGNNPINRCKKTVDPFEMEAISSTIPKAIENIRKNRHSVSIICYMSEHIYQFPHITNDHYLRYYVGTEQHFQMLSALKDKLYTEMIHFRLNNRGMEYVASYPTKTYKGDNRHGYLPEDS